ncbi:hypothetical protein V494_06855 [Pseudogymnoascus sp. VKM F-4513 (FW-928)]|nr:hypothetical protein V494_06855 [Pseudogymnoascus sp. VKM F-4513 (FW-928)]
MEPSFKKQRILGTHGQERHSPGYDGPSRPYNPATFRQRLESKNGAVYGHNNSSTKFYDAVDAREGSPNFEGTNYDDDYEDSGEESYEEEAPEADLQATRQKLDNRLKSTFEAIFEKYGKDFTGVGDEIDLRTGEIIVDNGHVAEMHTETDAGEGRGRGMLRAFTEEPEHSQLPQQDTDDSDNADGAHEDMDMEYHVRGRQMLRAFTQEPEFERDAATEEDENEYDGDTSKLPEIDEESDDDDILYQSSGIIPAKSMAPPPRPPIYKPYRQKPLSTFRAPIPAPKPRRLSSSVAYPSEPDIIAQFGQELGPRIADYVSRQTSVDEGTIDPKWRTPALPAATAGKRPILKSMILEPDTDRSPSPNGNSLWAPEKVPRRRVPRSSKKDKGPSGESESIVRDPTLVLREGITRSRVSVQAAHQPKSAQIDAPEIPPQQDLASENTGQNADDDTFGDKEFVGSARANESEVDDSENSESAKRKRKRPESAAASSMAPRRGYTAAEDRQIIEWAKWIYDSGYGVSSLQKWELLSEKDPRHSGTAFMQRYRRLLSLNGGKHPFLEPGRIHSVPSADESSSYSTLKTREYNAEAVASRFEPFKDILHELYIEEGFSLKKVSKIMERQHGLKEHHGQYKKKFREWGFEKIAHLWDDPGYAGLTRTEAINRRRREKRKQKANQRERLAMKRMPLLMLDPDETDQVEAQNEVEARNGVDEQNSVEARNEQRRSRRLRRPELLEKKGQLPNPNHDESEQRIESNRTDAAEIGGGPEPGTEVNMLHKDNTEANTPTHNEAGKDGGGDGNVGPSDGEDLYDLSKLFQGASDYISPNSGTAMEENQTVELPKNKTKHNLDSETNHTGRSLRSRVIPNSQSSQQDLVSPSTSQVRQSRPTAPTVALNGDVLDPSYMFSDEEDEAAPVVPPNRASNPQSSSTTVEPHSRQPLSDSDPVITPPEQKPDILPQGAPADTLPAAQSEAVITSVEIKDEPEIVGRGLGDIYSLPRSPPRLSTAPQPPTSDGTLRVVTKQLANSSPLTSPAARTPTPPTTVSKTTPMPNPALESTPRRSQKSLLGLSSMSTPRRNHMERSTSRPRLTSRSAGSVRSRASMTPISRLPIRSPLRHEGGEEENEDDSGDAPPSLSQRSRAIEGGTSNLSVTGTPSRRGRVGSVSGGTSEDGDLIQTPGGAWRRCGESGYKCGRGFCFRCSVGGEGEVGV